VLRLGLVGLYGLVLGLELSSYHLKSDCLYSEMLDLGIRVRTSFKVI